MPKYAKIAKDMSRIRKVIQSDGKDAECMKKSIKKYLDEVDKQISGHAAKKNIAKESAKPSQFERKRPVIDAMADLAGWPRGSSHSRVDITKAICAYISKNNLQIPGNAIFFRVDDELKKLIPIEKIAWNVYDDDTKLIVHGKKIRENVEGPTADKPWLSYPVLQKHIASLFAA